MQWLCSCIYWWKEICLNNGYHNPLDNFTYTRGLVSCDIFDLLLNKCTVIADKKKSGYLCAACAIGDTKYAIICGSNNVDYFSSIEVLHMTT